MRRVCKPFPSYLLIFTFGLVSILFAQLVGSSQHPPASAALQLQYGSETAKSY